MKNGLSTDPVNTLTAYFVVSDALNVTPSMMTTMGDLVATTQGLIFIPYKELLLTKGAFQFAAGILSLPLGLALNQRNENEIAEAKDDAAKARAQDYGLSMKDRIQKRKGQVLPVSVIKSVEAKQPDSKGIGTLTLFVDDNTQLPSTGEGQSASSSQKTHNFLIKDPVRAKERIERWLAGDVIQEPDVLGMNLGVISPEAMVDLLQGKDTLHVPASLQDKIAEDKSYLNALLIHIKSKPVQAQHSIIEATQALSPTLKAALSSTLGGELRLLRYTSIGLALGAIIIILASAVGSVFAFLYIAVAFFSFVWFVMRLGKGKFLRTEWAYTSFALGSVAVFPYMNDNPVLVTIIVGILCVAIPLGVLFNDYKRMRDWKSILPDSE